MPFAVDLREKKMVGVLFGVNRMWLPAPLQTQRSSMAKVAQKLSCRQYAPEARRANPPAIQTGKHPYGFLRETKAGWIVKRLWRGKFKIKMAAALRTVHKAPSTAA